MEITQTPEDTQYLSSLRNDKAREKAAALGLEIIVPDEYTLTLDLDAPEGTVLTDSWRPAQYTKIIGALSGFYGAPSERVTTSVNGGRHLYLTFTKAFTEMEKLALQAALGSDPMRELLGVIRVKEALGPGSLMFEKPVNPTLATISLSLDDDVCF